MRRICESVATTVLGGLILWSVTSATSPPKPGDGKLPAAEASAVGPAPAADSPPSAARATEPLEPPAAATLLLPAPLAGPTPADAPPPRSMLPYSVPAGSILLYEDFAGYKEGDTADWGPNTFIKTGLDRRRWLVSNVEGTHPVGCRIRLPSEWYFECRYSAYLPEVTRGLLGWWKEPLAGKVSFLNDQGARYVVQWAIRCGPDPTRLNPLGSSSLCAKTYYHAVKLPDGTAHEVGILQPTGLLRIQRDSGGVKVFLDGQSVVVGATGPGGQVVGFEIDVLKTKNAALCFTDFKIGR